MLSKIQIGISQDQKTCIKVQQRVSDDVRDELVQLFKEKLNLISNSASIEFVNGYDGAIQGTDFVITPIEDEIKHFISLLENKYLKNRDRHEDLMKISNMIVRHSEIQNPENISINDFKKDCEISITYT